jgi:succinoglycan biosynthesis transport protein ExoP
MSMQATEIQLHQVVRMLSRRRKLILAMGVLGGVLAGAVGSILPERYTAKAQIVIDPLQVSSISGPSGRPELVDELAIETQVTMLTARRHLRRVRDSLVANAAPMESVPHPRAEAGRHDESLPASAAAETAEAADPAPTLEELESNLKVYQERNSRVIAVTYTSTDPEKAAAIANEVARRYVESQADRKKEEKSGGWLELELSELNHQLSMARSDLAARQARLGAVRDVQRRKGGAEELGEALGAEVLGEIRRDQVALMQAQKEPAATSTDAHPDLQAAAIPDLREKVAREIERVASRLDNEAKIAGGRVRSLEQRLATIQAAQGLARAADLRSSVAQPEAAGGTQPYEGLLRRQQQEMSTPADAALGMRILSVADAPMFPSSPNPALFIFPALVAFLIAGGFLATILEGLKRGLRTERDVKDALGVPCVGLVPRLPRSQRYRMHRSLLQNPFAAYTESIRSLVVAALQSAAPNTSPKVFLVTSSIQGEGKTKLAVSFAVYAARLQRRVLLVDFAFRNPAILHELEAKAEKGTLDVLNGHPLDGAIQRIADLNVDYLPLPGHPSDPLELLGSGKLADLIGKLRESYDCVVIDSAPLLGTTEMRLLLPLVDKVLFAVKWDSTRRELAENALNVISNAAPEKDLASFAYAVVTQVDLKKQALSREGDVAEVLARSAPGFSRAELAG